MSLNQTEHSDVSWADMSKGWPTILEEAYAKYIFANKSNSIPYGTYVFCGEDGLRVESKELLDKLEEGYQIVKKEILKEMEKTFLTKDEAKHRWGRDQMISGLGVKTLMQIEDEAGIWMPIYDSWMEWVGYKLQG